MACSLLGGKWIIKVRLYWTGIAENKLNTLNIDDQRGTMKAQFAKIFICPASFSKKKNKGHDEGCVNIEKYNVNKK